MAKSTAEVKKNDSSSLHLLLESSSLTDILDMLLEQFTESPSSVVDGDGSSSGEDSSNSSDDAPRSPASTDQSAPKSSSSRRVQFKDVTPHDDFEEPLDETSMLDRIEALQNRLASTQVELVKEKKVCKRKQRSLLKLAREVGKRFQDSRSLQVRVLELSKELTETKEQLKESNAERDAHRVLLGQRTNIKPPETISTRNTPTTTQQQRRSTDLIATILGLAFVLAGVVLYVAQPELLTSRNSWCGPAMPGTRLNKGTTHHRLESPWWISASQQKEWVFETVCRGRPRVVLDWDDATGQVTIQQALPKSNQESLEELPLKKGHSLFSSRHRRRKHVAQKPESHLFQSKNSDKIASVYILSNVVALWDEHRGILQKIPAPWEL